MSVLPSENILNATTKSPNFMVRVTEASAAALAMDPLSHVGDGIFLQTKTAQGIAGAFVWVALFLTCQQVCRILFSNLSICSLPETLCFRRCVLFIVYIYCLYLLSLNTFTLHLIGIAKR